MLVGSGTLRTVARQATVRFKVDGNVVDAHRVAWVIANGREVPDDMDVCHSCDVRPCVNPDHLFLGTRSENMIDARDKGRLTFLHGEKPTTQC